MYLRRTVQLVVSLFCLYLAFWGVMLMKFFTPAHVHVDHAQQQAARSLNYTLDAGRIPVTLDTIGVETTANKISTTESPTKDTSIFVTVPELTSPSPSTEAVLEVLSGAIFRADASAQMHVGDDGRVSRWEDADGRNLYVVQPDPESQPIRRVRDHGLPTLRFDGRQVLKAGPEVGFPLFESEFAVCAVGSMSRQGVVPQLVAHDSDGLDGWNLYFNKDPDFNAALVFKPGSNNGWSTGYAFIPQGQPDEGPDAPLKVFCGVRNGSVTSIWERRNGETLFARSCFPRRVCDPQEPPPQSGGEPIHFKGAPTLWVGTKGGDDCNRNPCNLVGDIAEVVLFPYALSELQRQHVMHSLAEKWQVA